MTDERICELGTAEQCKACLKECRLNTIGAGDLASNAGKCVQCPNCFARCPNALDLSHACAPARVA